MTFKQEDVLSFFNPTVEAALSGDAKFALFDNGKKVEEVNAYAGSLAVGSAFVVHDWDQEVVYSAIEETLTKHGFRPRYNDLAYELNSHLRFFIRTDSVDVNINRADGSSVAETFHFSPFEDVQKEMVPWCKRLGLEPGPCEQARQHAQPGGPPVAAASSFEEAAAASAGAAPGGGTERCAAAGSGGDNLVEQLRQLAELMSAGALTGAEFAAAKRKLLV
jgi:hypothetical protein